MKNKPYPYYNVPYVNNLREYLEYCEKTYKKKTAFSYKHQKVIIKKTYIQFYSEVKYFSSKLISLGYNNCKIAIIGENSYEWILTYFSIVCSGNVVIPIDKTIDKDALYNILEETKPELIFISDEYQDYSKFINKKIKNIYNLSTDIVKLVNSGRTIYVLNNNIYNNVNILPNNLAAIIYTSGTTGFSKGVMLTHKNICSNYYGGRKNLSVRKKSILVLPLYHIYCFVGGVLCVMGCGTEIFIGSLKGLRFDMQEQNPYIIAMVPMMVEMFYHQIWSRAEEQKKTSALKKLMAVSDFLINIGIDLRKFLFKNILQNFGGKLEIIICGGAPLEKNIIKDFRSFGIQIIQGYGITECSPMVAVTRNHYFKDDSVGLKLPNVDIIIDRFAGETEGEILVKGESVTAGYYNNPLLTNNSFNKDGYFKTGDIGYIDKDGFVFITGRKKNMIVLSNGKNVYPEELEAEWSKLSEVKEILVYEKDKSIVAEIFPDKNALDSRGVSDYYEWFNRRLDDFNKTHPTYKNISRIVLRDTEFPKTTSMKIKRNYNQ